MNLIENNLFLLKEQQKDHMRINFKAFCLDMNL
jgi:hypothetical protein